jgi:hypothetical protein
LQSDSVLGDGPTAFCCQRACHQRRARIRTELGAEGTHAEPLIVRVDSIEELIELLCLPTAPMLPVDLSGDFGTSPFFGQLSGKQAAAGRYD